MGAYIDGAMPPSPFLSIIRFSNLIVWSFLYLGIREEPERHKKEHLKKEIKIEGGMFRISKRPEQLQRKKYHLYKEKKICIVCKGIKKEKEELEPKVFKDDKKERIKQ